MELLTKHEIDEAFKQPNKSGFGKSRYDIARAIEAAVIEKVKARRVGHWNGDCTFPVFLTGTKGTTYCNVPLYRLPEGD